MKTSTSQKVAASCSKLLPAYLSFSMTGIIFGGELQIKIQYFCHPSRLLLISSKNCKQVAKPSTILAVD